MSAAERKATSIAKEQVNDLRFPAEEVLKSKDDIRKRRADLERAVMLGNVEKSKVRVYFEDEVGLRYVETTIWSITDDRVILKGDGSIPLRRVVQVVS